MLSLIRSRCVWGLGMLCLLLTLLASSGCTGRPENSPVVRKKFQELADVQTQMGDLAVQVKQMTAEMAAVRTDLGAVKSLSGGGEAIDRIDQIDVRMQTIEQEIVKMREAMTAESKSRQVASSAPAKDSNEESAKSESGSSRRSETHASAPKPKSSAPVSHASSTTPQRQSSNTVAAKPKPRGAYYTIAVGDTAQSIAQKNGISLDSLLQANKLPKDATIFPGQKLYVPVKD